MTDNLTTALPDDQEITLTLSADAGVIVGPPRAIVDPPWEGRNREGFPTTSDGQRGWQRLPDGRISVRLTVAELRTMLWADAIVRSLSHHPKT